MASWRVALEVLLLAVLLSCSFTHSSGDFFSRLLSNEVCSGIVTNITDTDERECATSGIDRPTLTANDSFEVVKYQWQTGAPQEVTDRQCLCGLQLVLQLTNGVMPSSLCTEESPIDCSFCETERERFNETNCQSYFNSACEFSCVIKSTNGTSVLALMAGLDCDVLRRYTRDICPNLFQSTTLMPTSPDYPDGHGNEIALGVGLTLGVVGTTVVAVTVCCIWCACYRKRASKRQAIADRDAHTLNSKEFRTCETVVSLENGQADSNPIVSQYYKEMFGKTLTSSANVRIIGELGEGAFCKVHSAVLVSEETGYLIEKQVAVKHLKANSTPEQVEDFISESAIMLNFDHPNVLHLLGVCFDTEDHFPLIILPLMSNGDLKSFLIRKRGYGDVDTLPLNLTIYHLLSMCLDIAKGMEYLAKMKYIHRDLAARNCMIDDKLHVKVADFGFSRDVYATQYYRLGHKTRLPVKWMPPESLLDNIYNERSDVWSYGVTCWEVFSLGRGPYPGVDNAEITDYISNGNRLKQPPLCPDDVYSILLSCWFHKSSERPKFSALVEYLNRVIEHEPHPDHDDDRLQQNQDTQEFNRPYFVLEATSKAHCSANGSS